MFNIFMKPKKYGHIISLGYNCEVSFQFFKKYNFVESSLFAWSGIPSCRTLVNALNHIDLILTDGLTYTGSLYRDNATNVSFHGKAFKSSDETEQDILNELISRTTHLKEKFITTTKDGKKNLYIFKYPPVEVTLEEMKSDILSLYNTLKNLVANEFDLLIVLEKKTHPDLQFDFNNLFIRRVKFFTPASRATSKPYDKKHWGRIFSEFRPDFKLPKTKRFKFEEEN